MTKYYVDNEVVEKDEFDERLEEAINNYVEDNIDDIIDDQNEMVQIGSLTYYPSQVLKECDPVAYRCYISDEADYELSNAEYDLERGDEIEINYIKFRIEEEDEEEDE